MGIHTFILRGIWPALCIGMTAAAVLDYGPDTLATHLHLPIAFLLCSFVPLAVFAKVHGRSRTAAGRVAALVAGTLGLGVLTAACVSLDFGQFQPSPFVALVYVAWTLPLFALVAPAMAIDILVDRARAKRCG